MNNNNSQLHNKSQAWSALFNEPMSDLVKRYTASVFFDKRLAKFDIQGSIAHAKMLANKNIISTQDYTDIEQGLNAILQEINTNTFDWQLDLEDVHLNIEARLTEKIGVAGKRLHTGRSRNDQVATDLRLWLLHEVSNIEMLLKGLQNALVFLAKEHVNTIMPGFTHLQVAQPVSFAHHLLAYYEMFARDIERLQDSKKRINTMPLGSAALAGTSYPIDRLLAAQYLGFERICQNSLDAVSDRDFAIEFTANASLIMMHISRLSEELIMWMNPQFAFIEISDSFCTGSSIMPQKKNPDVPELARGKSARVFGHLIALLVLMKAQPLAYNKDNQEDKEPLFDTVDTVSDTLRIFIDMIVGIKVKPENMYNAVQKGYATATDLADYFVKQGMAFRDAHEAVASIVHYAISQQKQLSQLSIKDIVSIPHISCIKDVQNYINADIVEILTVECSMAARNHIGGPSPTMVAKVINDILKNNI
jgi:argininosuccinate lyase